MSKLLKMKSFITSLFGIKEYRLNSEGKLDVSAEDYAKLAENYGAEFITKFEKMLGDEVASASLSEQKDTKQAKSDMNLTLLCALLSVQAISFTDGKVTLSEEQLGKIEAGLKKLQDEKTAAESSLATAKTDKEAAESSLSGTVKAMDELDTTVKAAKTPAEKVEAIRVKLAAKPAVATADTHTETDLTKKKIEGADAINEYVNEIL